MTDTPDETARTPRTLLRVVSGEPTPEELAALLAVVGARAAGAADAEQPAPRSPWAAPVLRRPLHPSPGAWRASALPG